MRLVVPDVVHPLRAGKRRPVNRLFTAAAEIHPMSCGCSACEPYAPRGQHLDVQTKAKLAIAAALVGTAIAFLVDPAGAAEALRSTVLP